MNLEDSENIVTSVLLLPVYNEIEALKVLIPRSIGKFDDIVVIDGGSRDGSIQYCRSQNIDVIQQKNKGKASGVIQALRSLIQLKYDHIVIIDADNTCEPDEAHRLVGTVNPGSILLGNRFHNGRPKSMDRFSYFTNRLVSWIISKRCKLRIEDAQTPFWILSRESARQLIPHLKSKYFDLEIDMVISAAYLDMIIIQKPINYHNRIGKSKFSFRFRFIQIWKVLYHLLRQRTP